MVDFVRLQEIIKEQLEYDRTIRTVTVSGATLEITISDAAALLDLPIRRLEYEIVEKGSDGFMGVGKKDWTIQAYEHTTSRKKKHAGAASSGDAADQGPVIQDKDGDAFIHLGEDGEALLKVTAPTGKGKRAPEVFAHQLLQDRGVKDIDEKLVSKIFNEAAGTYVKVGVYDHEPGNDSLISVEVSDDEMQASIIITPPGHGGCDISFESCKKSLSYHKITHGIKEDFLRDLMDRPQYREKIVAAEGTNPVDGADAYIQYNFQTDSKVRLRESSTGRIDFKELNIIQNVTENQVLAQKIPPGEGTKGATVRGRILPTKAGRDIGLPVGTNIHAGAGGDTILSDINGQVMLVNGLINVEPVYTVDGDVNLKTGNIFFLGTVIVKGNVDDGFSIKAAGNIEVNGTVGKSELDAEGDIIIHAGVNGKAGGNIRAGKSFWARFIENTNVEAGNMVVASDGIINSQVDAGSRIVCQGKRANIMGGRLRAAEEINAKVIGNPTGGVDTVCEVGFDPKTKEELAQLFETKYAAEKEMADIKINLQSLINIKKQRKVLPEDKEVYLRQLMERRQELDGILDTTTAGIQKMEEFMKGLAVKGRVSASAKIYPGVKIMIRDVREEVRNEYKAATFILENGLVRISKYEEPDESVKKGPDGFTTN
ncbi:MAG: FapA family protein [Treponema sp.]|jgi:uncharacterized protein (DUF342 family)|nr:FapA family protein [Treponema sp.]